MKTQNITIVLAIVLGLSIAACEPKPKVIAGELIDNDEPAVFDKNLIESPDVIDGKTKIHTVRVEEALNTERYTYLNVTEGDNMFWIAISKAEVKIGETYAYYGGLLKKNFQSKEFDRVFDTIYLVSDFRNHPINSGGSGLKLSTSENQEPDLRKVIAEEAVEGVIKIVKLFSDPNEYQGKVVKVKGKCVKVNPMIMNRNWVHIQDGSGDHLDLTITTTENISLGTIVSLEGTIALNKDFGAGYRYDIIMEGAVLK